MTDSITRWGNATTSEGFRAMMRGFPTGVAVVTATDVTGRPWGMTCSSVCSVTLEPPTLLVCLRVGSPTLAAAVARGLFAVNLLREDGRATAELFASGRPDRFELVEWDDAGGSAAGPHLTADSHAVADCRLVGTQQVGDHLVVLGEVLGVTRQEAGHPLLYGMGGYGRLATAKPGR